MSAILNYDTLLFDLDGTVTEPFEGITKCILHALEALERPLPPAESLRWCIGPSLYESFHKLLETEDKALVEKAVELYRVRFRTHGMFENRPYEEVRHALARLSKTHTLYIVTSKPWVFAEEILAHFELEPYFWKVYGSELSGDRVNKAELIAYMLSKETINRDRTLMIGDREHDVRGAKANGIRAAGILWGYGSREELEAAGADYIFETVMDLEKAVLKPQNGQ